LIDAGWESQRYRGGIIGQEDLDECEEIILRYIREVLEEEISPEA
jgi:hypothetical protein